MRHSVAKLGLVFLVGGGCSLIYNESNIKVPPDAKIFKDGPPPDTEVIVDANPTAIGITDVYPAMILEGSGIGNSRPAIVIIHGHDFDSGRHPAVTFTTADASVADFKVAADHQFIAVAVNVPINACMTGSTKALT